MAAKLKVAPVQAIRKLVQRQGRYTVPLGGLNYRESLLTMQPSEALVLDNFIPRAFGIEIRKGWRYWAPKANKFPNEVRSILVFTDAKPIGSKIFAGTADPGGLLYDVTTQGVAPTLALTPSTAPFNPGEWYATNYTTPGGSFFCAVSQGAGYYLYDSTAGWREVPVGAAVGQIKFPAGDTTTPKDFAFCWLWKNRLWFLKGGSATAYYLPIGQITGEVAALELGPQLIHGGSLLFATSWTYDSGRGIDDGLVFASTEGDILVYQGSDPTALATFSLQGLWYTGRFPGRRCFNAVGGDVVMVTEFGVIKISDLVSGKVQTSAVNGEDAFYKINPRLARYVSDTIGQNYWFVLPFPTEELVVFGAPYIEPVKGVRTSFILNYATSAWASLSNADLLCGEVYRGQIIFGTRDGYVCQLFYGYNDQVSADGTDVGIEVTGRLQTAFNNFDDPRINKRLLRIKLYGLSDGVPTLGVKFVDEYNMSTVTNAPAPIAINEYTWDVGLWDDAKWQSTQIPFRRWFGVAGFGKKLAMIMAIRGRGYTLLSDYEALYESGYNL